MNDLETRRPTRSHDLLTVAEACDALRISRWMFYRLIQRHDLRTITIGSRRFVTRADVLHYIEERRQEATR